MAHWLTSREYRDANRHIAAAQEHLRLAAHYIKADDHVLIMVGTHCQNLEVLSREVGKVAEDAKEREETK